MWNEVFHSDECVIPDTEFMKRLQKFLSSEQANLMLNRIKNKLAEKREGFCEASLDSTHTAKTHLLALFTQTVLVEARYVFGKVKEECRHLLETYQEESNQVKKLQEDLQGKRIAAQDSEAETEKAFAEFQTTLDQEISQQPVGGTAMAQLGSICDIL